MSDSFRELYAKLTRSITRFADVFVQSELDCEATVEIEHEGRSYVVTWDGIRRPQDFRILERNGSSEASPKDWRSPARPDYVAAVAVALHPLHKEARRVVHENARVLESARAKLQAALTAPTPPESAPEPPDADAPSGSPGSPEPDQR